MRQNGLGSTNAFLGVKNDYPGMPQKGKARYNKFKNSSGELSMLLINSQAKLQGRLFILVEKQLKKKDIAKLDTFI
jgi:hypothetical protein